MEVINHKYNIELEILTPLSIGAGTEKDWVRGVDFIINNHKLYKLNLKKMIREGISAEELSNLFSSKNEAGLKSKLAGKIESVSDMVIPCPIESDNDVKAFVKNQMTGNPVLTGSSLKGAIRSVLFDYLGGESKDGKEVFGSSTEGDEFMRFVKISDAEFNETSLINTKIFNLQKKGSWQGGWKHGQNETSSNYKATGFNTLYECLMPEQKGYSSLMLAEQTLSNFGMNTYYRSKIAELNDKIKHEYREDKKSKFLKEKHQYEKLLSLVDSKEKLMHHGTIFEIINNHTRKYLEKEKLFFEKYSTDRTDEIVESIDFLLGSIPTDNSFCILKMSAGAGFHSITGDWQFDDYTKGMLDRKRAEKKDLSIAGKILPKSRKIAVYEDSLSLMGFVKMKTISDDEIENRRKEAERQEAERLVEIQRQKEVEERERREAEERIIKYKALISEAQKYFESEQYEESLSQAKEAATLLPNGNDHSLYITLSQSKIDEINRRKEAEAKAIQEAAEKEKSNQIPLKEKISSANKIGTLCGNTKTWLKYNPQPSNEDLTAFKNKLNEIYNSLKPKEQKDLQNFSKWKAVVELFGEDIVKKWFDEIIK